MPLATPPRTTRSGNGPGGTWPPSCVSPLYLSKTCLNGMQRPTDIGHVGMVAFLELPGPKVPGLDVVVLVPELVGKATRRGDRLDGEAVFDAARSLP